MSCIFTMQGTAQVNGVHRSSVGCCLAHRVLGSSVGYSVAHRVLVSLVGYSVAYLDTAQLSRVQRSSEGVGQLSYGELAHGGGVISGGCSVAQQGVVQLRRVSAQLSRIHVCSMLCSVAHRVEWSSQGAVEVTGCSGTLGVQPSSNKDALKLSRVQQSSVGNSSLQLRSVQRSSRVQRSEVESSIQYSLSNVSPMIRDNLYVGRTLVKRTVWREYSLQLCFQYTRPIFSYLDPLIVWLERFTVQLSRVQRSPVKLSQPTGCSMQLNRVHHSSVGCSELCWVQHSSVGCSIALLGAAQLCWVQHSSVGCSVALLGAKIDQKVQHSFIGCSIAQIRDILSSIKHSFQR